MPFLSFSFFFLPVIARTSSTMMNRGGKSRHPCIVPNLKGKTSSLSPLSMLAMHFLYMPFAGLRKLSAICSVLCVLSQKDVWFFKIHFFAPFQIIMWFLWGLLFVYSFYFWLHCIFFAGHRLSLVATRGWVTLCCGVWASHCGDLLWGVQASVVAALRLSSLSSWA